MTGDQQKQQTVVLKNGTTLHLLETRQGVRMWGPKTTWSRSIVAEVDELREQAVNAIRGRLGIPQLTILGDGEWQPMEVAPVGVRVEVLVLQKGGGTKMYEDAHWASDLSGEDQPPFEGWFVPCGEHSFQQIEDPIAWRPRQTQQTQQTTGIRSDT